MEFMINSMEQVRESFSFPNTMSEARRRMKLNLRNYCIKYAIVTLFVLYLSLLGQPESMFAFINFLIDCVVVYFFDEDPFVDYECLCCALNTVTIMAFTGFCTLCILLFLGTWIHVLVSILIGSAIASVHAAFKNVAADHFFDEEAHQILAIHVW